MENPCKLVLFGDSITKGYAPKFKKKLKERFSEIDLDVINAGVSGETSRQGLSRLNKILDLNPDVVVIGFGMNDWRKGIDCNEFKKNIVKMIEDLEEQSIRVVVNTVSPSYNFDKKEYNCQTDKYSKIVRDISYEKKVKIADINALWKQEMNNPKKALRDELHPNSRGYQIICKALMRVVPRKNTTILWQYNGKEAKCNYRCPYCYYIGLHSPKDRFFGTVEEWHNSFKEAFRNQNLVFYLGHGEPTFGDNFLDVLEMISNESNWKMRITSNVSCNLENIVKSKLAKEERLFINASFHPVMTDKNIFLKRINYLRNYGIEVSITYVAYPPYLQRLEDDINYFSDQGFVVHVRRFQGKYKNKDYPYDYTEEERKLIAKYCDDGMIKYMLNQQTVKEKLTYAGLHFFIIDNVGNAGYDSNIFKPYTKYHGIFGNIHSGNFKPNLEPKPYPGTEIGTDDGVANILDYDYKELKNNHVLSFAKQGGVYKDSDGKVIYSNKNKNFDDPEIRAEYNFPPRDRKDYLAYLKKFNKNNYKVIKSNFYKKLSPHVRKRLKGHPRVKNMLKKLISK